MKNVTLRQLRVFAAVARHLSFTRAAEDLNLTAPAVSMQIKDFEAEVGLPVFDRTSRQVSLTTVGEYMLAHTRRVLAAMRDAEDLVARFRGLQTGPLDVGMVSTAEYFLPRLLAQKAAARLMWRPVISPTPVAFQPDNALNPEITSNSSSSMPLWRN
ncbi:MAG: LysR family transcriptional regulator [Steroidobacteraceae bacterium]